jgi:hypothetical protein
MKTAIIVAAALCASLWVSVPAAEAKGPTDMQLYCMFLPMTKDCAKPAAPVKMAKPAPMKIATMAPVAAKPKTGMKTMSCVKAPAGKAHLYDCTWK